MNWIVLVVSGCFEAVWAVALSKSEGFTHLTPALVFVGGLVISMAGLAFAMQTLPAGTSYAVWVGIGASLTVLHGMLVGSEPVTTAKLVFLAGLIGCIIGLKAVSSNTA